MKKPSDRIKIPDEILIEKESEFYRLGYTFVSDFDMSIEDAGEVAYLAMELQELEKLRNDLEGLL